MFVFCSNHHTEDNIATMDHVVEQIFSVKGTHCIIVMNQFRISTQSKSSAFLRFTWREDFVTTIQKVNWQWHGAFIPWHREMSRHVTQIHTNILLDIKIPREQIQFQYIWLHSQWYSAEGQYKATKFLQIITICSIKCAYILTFLTWHRKRR